MRQRFNILVGGNNSMGNCHGGIIGLVSGAYSSGLVVFRASAAKAPPTILVNSMFSTLKVFKLKLKQLGSWIFRTLVDKKLKVVTGQVKTIQLV